MLSEQFRIFAMLQWIHLSIWGRGCLWLTGKVDKCSACQTIGVHSSHRIYAIIIQNHKTHITQLVPKALPDREGARAEKSRPGRLHIGDC